MDAQNIRLLKKSTVYTVLFTVLLAVLIVLTSRFTGLEISLSQLTPSHIIGVGLVGVFGALYTEVVLEERDFQKGRFSGCLSFFIVTNLVLVAVRPILELEGVSASVVILFSMSLGWFAGLRVNILRSGDDFIYSHYFNRLREVT